MPSQNSIVLSPGFGSTQALGTMTPLVEGLVKRGHRVRYIPSLRTPATIAVTLHGRYPVALARQAQHIIQVMTTEQLSGSIGMGHSFGCLPIIVAALEQPWLFDQLILLCPAGLRNMRFGELAMRFLLKSAQDCKRVFSDEAERRLLARQGLVGASDYFGNPYSAGLAFREALVAAKSYDLIPEVEALGKPVIVLYAENDTFFPRQKTEEALERHPSFQKVLLKGASHDAHLWYATLLESLDASGALDCSASQV